MKMVLKIFGVLLCGYIVVMLYIYFMQDKLIFPAHRLTDYETVEPQSEAEQTLTIVTPEGATLVGVLTEREDEKAPLVICFGGNAHDVVGFARYQASLLPGAHVAGLFYRGYAKSTGKPSEEAVYQDALQIYDTLSARYPDVPVYVTGLSMGTGVATYVASQRDVKGLTLIMPFDAIEEIAKARYWYLPVSKLIRHRFNSVANMEGVNVPVVILRAQNDMTVTAQRTNRLVETLENVVLDQTIKGVDHGTIHESAAYGLTLKHGYRLLMGEEVVAP